MKFKEIAIIGLGLMGGSLAARIRKRFPKTRIVGISRSREALRKALQKHWIHEAGHRIDSALSADLVLLCTPVDTFAKFLLALEKICRRGTLVTDVGSVKGEITHWIRRKKFRNIKFVGAHPMAGSHARGIQAARGNLFDRSFIFLIRTASVSSQKFLAVKNFWRKISPAVIEVSAEQHDRITSQISHLPHALAACLALTPEEKNLKFAATGFADTTRIAESDPSVWLPIFFANRKEILHSFRNFQSKLNAFRKALLKPEGRALLALLQKAKIRRESIRI